MGEKGHLCQLHKGKSLKNRSAVIEGNMEIEVKVR